ncbi:MAG: prepilin-type N-terminal cleavage/methylation domain-containing protein [Candidatus Sumerlaeota bacterium]|nr:prepilin-type N-terminal cleavage/methylation domain-containing protein [Candidatus Sumerlaeota bacterium]
MLALMRLAASRFMGTPASAPSSGRNRRFRRTGFTLVEVMIAMTIGVMVSLSVVVLIVVSGRLYKSIQAQQRFLAGAKKATEKISREFRYATTDYPIFIMDQGSVTNRGNRVQFNRLGETTIRAFYIGLDPVLKISNPSLVFDINKPWQNVLFYDPNIAANGNEVVVAKYVGPSRDGGCFIYLDATSPLEVNIRIGDPVINVTAANRKTSDAYTGPGLQGAEVNFYVAPRN